MTTLRNLETVPGGAATPTMSSKTLPPSLSLSQKPVKPPTPIAPRIDVEPIYTALKAGVGKNWNVYLETIRDFLTGYLNQQEVSRRIDPFICCDASLTHLHNQLICAIHTNAHRDPPEPGVAAFVSANDKPTAAAKPVSGDAAEQRLKVEIMKLPARERHRLKKIEEDPVDAFQQMMAEVHSSRQIRPPDLVPTGAGGYNTTTNWELEISKRFAQPLFSESNEFPDADSIQKRMIPIAYQEGLAGGASDGCSTLVNIAAEMYIKEQLAEVFQRTKSNGANYIQTGKFKRRKAKEEELTRRGEIKRDVFGLLPVEVETESKRRPFGLEDLRFAMGFGNSYLAQNKILSTKIANMPYWEEDRNQDYVDMKPTINGTPQKSNGTTNGVNGHHDEVMTDINVNDWWSGAGESDRAQLDDMLDDILAAGS
ncbi:transcriptional co-activator [Venturia nashicola]|uniref:Transcriptional co-activator n=1 Tax=Venturia nashicola TaxID=86259 RepID=A0A4Z1P680_9PEZI|nr:transcriptional co-activator [Venturia nashicola]TLD35120.1 transcriptional co-activator [Venturia nashicola]